MSTAKKLILVIGATGAQGIAVIDALLKPSEDGSPSPYSVRALTRDTNNYRAKSLTEQGVECVQGTFEDFDAVKAAMDGAYGAWVNTDTFTVGEKREIFAGMRIFEVAKQTPSMRHYVWSSLNYATKAYGYKPGYRAVHLDAKGRVADWLKAQPSVVSDSDMSWSAVSTGPYMDTIQHWPWAPLNTRSDGTVVFASPFEGQAPFISLTDLGFFARYTFDHRAETSAKDLEVASQMVGIDDIVKAFTKVTGKPAIHKKQKMEEWWSNFQGVDSPAGRDDRESGTTTIKQNFTAFFRAYGEGKITRDMEWLKSIHPKLQSLEEFMISSDYKGSSGTSKLKLLEDGYGLSPIEDKVAKL